MFIAAAAQLVVRPTPRFMPKHITQIPFPGGSGQVPTGAIQFENDWPGLFLREDSAIALRATILGLQQRLASHPIQRLVRFCRSWS